MPTLREYDTAPPEHGGEDGSLPVYTLTPECIRYLTEEEIAEKHRTAEEEKSARYRSVYDDLRLSLIAYRDARNALGGESVQGLEAPPSQAMGLW